MLEDFYPVRWVGGKAIVTLPGHIGASNAGQVRDALLSAINLGAVTLIADMTATVSCDHAGADAVVRAWQRTVSSGTEMRLVVTAKSVSRVFGLDRQVSVHPSLDAAAAASLPGPAAILAAARPRRASQPPDGNGAAPAREKGCWSRSRTRWHWPTVTGRSRQPARGWRTCSATVPARWPVFR